MVLAKVSFYHGQQNLNLVSFFFAKKTFSRDIHVSKTVKTFRLGLQFLRKILNRERAGWSESWSQHDREKKFLVNVILLDRDRTGSSESGSHHDRDRAGRILIVDRWSLIVTLGSQTILDRLIVISLDRHHSWSKINWNHLWSWSMPLYVKGHGSGSTFWGKFSKLF